VTGRLYINMDLVGSIALKLSASNCGLAWVF
jgi:hypothetical protein